MSLPDQPFVRARRSGEELLLERRVISDGVAQLDVFRAPYRITGLATALQEEGKQQLMNDNEAAGDEVHEEGTVLFEVPKRYPTSYTSQIEQL